MLFSVWSTPSKVPIISVFTVLFHSTLFSGFCLGLLDGKVKRSILVSHEKLAQNWVLVVCRPSQSGSRDFRMNHWQGGRGRQALVRLRRGVWATVLRRAGFWGIFGSKLTDHSLKNLSSHYWNVWIWEIWHIWKKKKKLFSVFVFAEPFVAIAIIQTILKKF